MSGNELIMKAPAGLDVPELLTTAEVAALLKVNRSTLSRWRSVGIGPRVTWLTANRRRRVAATGRRLTIRKQPSGQWFAVLKSGRAYVNGRTFSTRRDAQAWLARERAALAGGIDPRAGRATVRTLLPIWLEERQHAVSAKTYKSDAALPRLVPTSLAVMQVRAVTDREVSRVLIALLRGGLAESSVKRF
jgi:hypothetical protein